MINANAQLINDFYTAFKNSDFATMQSKYHPEAEFSDPVFPHLNAKEVKAMWQMLLTSARDLNVEFAAVIADEKTGSCAWDARYTFSRTGRHVHNRILANFEFKDGLIYRHKDFFDFWTWSRQALGMPGIILGWTPIIKNKVQKMADRNLRAFLSRS